MKHRTAAPLPPTFMRGAPSPLTWAGEPVFFPNSPLASAGGKGCRKNLIHWLAITMVFSFLLSGCSETKIYCANPSGTLAGVDVSAALVEEGMDSHGGFHGDGASYQKLVFSEEPAFPENWQDLPMSQGVHTLLYGGKQDNVYYSGILDAAYVDFPEVERGKWFFYDRHPQCADPYDAEAVFDRPSKNFTAALWDADSKILYYFEFDS